jgi:hypothetical protein
VSSTVEIRDSDENSGSDCAGITQDFNARATQDDVKLLHVNRRRIPRLGGGIRIPAAMAAKRRAECNEETRKDLREGGVVHGFS